MPPVIPSEQKKDKQTSFRFSEDFKRLLEALAEDQGVSQARVIEYAVREFAKRHRIQVQTTPPQRGSEERGDKSD